MATNSDLLPLRSQPEPDTDPAVVSIEDSGATFDVLASKTARDILAALYEEPGTASDIADEIDISLQNVGYHLDQLQDAGLVETVDTWYSSKGREMDVYAPTGEPLLLFAGDTDDGMELTAIVEEMETDP